MSIFGKIKNAIFGGEAKAQEAPAQTAPAADAPKAAISTVDVEQRLDSIPGADKLNWRSSIVDLLKLLGMDASYDERKELATELGMSGYGGSAEDNIALHRRVMNEIAANGGTVPANLRD